jgi:3'(2'), 5'-bisphosphate nucleotidase
MFRPLTSDLKSDNLNNKMTIPDIEVLLEIIQESSKAILEIYNDKNLFNVVDFKADHSPLTLADKKSHEIIASRLSAHYPEIPILSEEGKDIPYEKRKGWEYFWLVDPLDGTKEFIKRNGEFTINIALIRNRYPVLGIIHVPFQDTTYYAIEGKGAFKIAGGKESRLAINKNKQGGLTAVQSRSHASDEEEDFYRKNNVAHFINTGSALKFCMVAEGKADIYYRHGPTMEWDTAAGQAIVEAAGGKVTVADSGERFIYNKEKLRNGGFVGKSL